jgi:hypothetical protein
MTQPFPIAIGIGFVLIKQKERENFKKKDNCKNCYLGKVEKVKKVRLK